MKYYILTAMIALSACTSQKNEAQEIATINQEIKHNKALIDSLKTQEGTAAQVDSLEKQNSELLQRAAVMLLEKKE